MVREGINGQQGDRAVSHVVGVALLIGLTVIAALLVIVYAGGTVDDIEDRSRTDAAIQSLQQVDRQFESLREARSSAVEFSFPEGMSSRMEITEETEIELFVNGNATCTTGDIQIGTMVYESDQGRVAGYEFGGVWRGWGNSSTMVTPPQIEYRDGRIALSLSKMKGDLSTSAGSLGADLNRNETDRMNELVMRALFSNKTAAELQSGPTTPVGQPVGCSPGGAANVTIQVKGSPFATAWHQYAHQNYDDRLVSVTPPEDANVEKGDTVSMTFKLGNTAESNFVVEDTDAPTAVAGDANVDIEVTIQNAGDLYASQNVTFNLYDSSGSTLSEVASATAVEEMALHGKENVTHTFTVDSADTTEHTEYLYSIDTGDQVVNGTIVVGANGADRPNFEVTSLAAPASASLGEDVTVDAVIENTGDLEGAQGVIFSFDGSTVATETVAIDGGNQTTLSFEVTPDTEGLSIPLNVSTADDSNVETIDIGDGSYFEVNTTRGPSSVATGETFEVNATIRNGGERSATQSVTILVQNVSTGTNVSTKTVSMTLDGTLAGSETGTVNHSVAGISEPGRYNYTVQTANASKTSNFYVGANPSPLFLVSGSDAQPNPVEQNSTVDISGAINNTGSESGTQTVKVSFDGSSIGSESVTLGAGNGTIVDGFSKDIPATMPAGTYTYTIETANTTLTNEMRVVENITNVIGNGSGGTITVNENITARLDVLGTALTGMGYDYIIRAPVTMYVYTESPSGEVEEHKFWGDSDLNTPRGRQDQIAGADYLSHTINVSAGSNLSVFGSSHYCDGWQDSGIDRTVEGYYGEFDAYRCGDRGGERITIDSSQNPSNLVILGDGEEVPAWGAAEDDQRSVGDILQDKMHDNGTLNLEPDQRVLMYELSEANADPDDATPGVSGDPDYNDAVVLFEVVNRTQTIDVKAPARFEITDVSAPAQVDEGSTAELDVTVENAGEATNDTDINYYFDGGTSGSQHVNLTGGESTTITFDVPPSASASTGTHSYTVEVDRNPDEQRSGSIYVGSASEAKFIVQGYEESYPRTVKQGSAASVSVTIANVGDADGTQNVEIDWDGLSDPDETKVVSIDSDESREFTYDIPTDALGTFDFTVSTENDSSTQTVHVRNAAFVVNRVLVGPEEYSEGDTIVSTALSNIRGEIENIGDVAGDRDVTFTLTNRSTGESVSDTESVSLAGGGVDLAEFDLGPWSDAPGYYDYEIDTGDDTFTGTVQIVEAGSVDEPEPDTYISIDMNVITIESND